MQIYFIIMNKVTFCAASLSSQDGNTHMHAHTHMHTHTHAHVMVNTVARDSHIGPRK